MRMFRFAVMLMISITSTLASCQSNKNVQELNAVEFSDKLSITKEAQLIDVRTPDEYNGGHLPNAFNLDWNGSDFKTAVANLDKSKPTFVYCLSGARSGSAAAAMADMGFKNVYQLKGGIRAWLNAGKETTTPTKETKPGMTIADYQAKTNAANLVLVDFNAPWCGPCKQMAPMLEQLATDHKSEISLLKINVDENKDVANMMKAEALPLLVLYKGGATVWQHKGLVDIAELEAVLAKYH